MADSETMDKRIAGLEARIVKLEAEIKKLQAGGRANRRDPEPTIRG